MANAIRSAPKIGFGRVFTLYSRRPRPALAPQWYYTGTTQVLHWKYTRSTLHWRHAGSTLVLHWCCAGDRIGTTLALHWYCTGVVLRALAELRWTCHVLGIAGIRKIANLAASCNVCGYACASPFQRRDCQR